ncbi:hypothetical protein ABIE44_001742 [Marmoricola sp. OAE513]|uniref:hypothetical protein n=1 Tax=Marmoricola sp. OAE513 TaxID=2817894 RepID=UPI001AEB6860
MTERSNRLLLGIAGLLVVSGLVHLGVFALDDRPWGGPVSWRKPFTFGLSFGVTLAAVVWLARRLDVPGRSTLLWVFAIDCVVEVGGITLQAWRHQPSHLNTSTPLNTAVAMSLAVGGGVLILVLGIFAVAAVRGRTTGGPSTEAAYRAGFALLIVGLLSGAAMIARGSIARADANTADVVYRVTGFVKDFHGVTLHGVLVLPAIDWILERLGTEPARRLTLVRSATTAYVLVALGVLALDLVRAF